MSTATARKLKAPTSETVRRVALVLRVSTDRQAMNPEGSLKNQVQRLRQHVAYKRDACGEDWQEVALYELKAISGKHSMRRPELEPLFADIRAGRVNAVLCTALDRICRNVRDFLWFMELLNEYGVEFICLKQNYDTTTPQGKLFITIMMALAEFEREQTGERTRDASIARTARGLWNGGRLLGYDADPTNKGSLIPNADEAAIVNFAFATYIAKGSLKETTDALNQRGYRTKVYSSRRGKEHAGVAFNLTSVQYLLKNLAYVAKKEVTDEDGGHRVVDAVWPAIIEQGQFDEVQRLMAVNGRSRHNGAQTIRHVHALTGLLGCGRCGGHLEGRSGTGSKGKVYFYYCCKNPECRLRVAAEEVEGAVIEQLGVMAQEEGLLEQLVAETNARLLQQAPALLKQQKALKRQMDQVNADAGRLLTQWASLDGSDAQAFLREQLDGLAQRRLELEASIVAVAEALRQVEDRGVTVAVVREALAQVHQVYAHLKPFEQRELLRLVVHRVEVRDTELVLEVKGNACSGGGQAGSTPLFCSQRFETPEWLPEQDSNLQQAG